MKKPLERICNGTKNFRTHVYAANQETYRRAASEDQKPDTLFITCADSRIDPELLTGSGPGQIFVARNIGNLVPPYSQFVGGVSAIIEYAVMILKVEQIVICGHEDCGALKSLINPTPIKTLTSVTSWLHNAQAALSVAKALNSAAENTPEFLHSLIEQNVLLQLNHIRTHPAVAGRLAQKNLDVYGWTYTISTGEIKMYDEGERIFKVVNPL